MSDDFGYMDKEVERRLKMAYRVNPRPITKIECHKPPTPGSPKTQITTKLDIPPELMTEDELSAEINKLSRKPLPPDNITRERFRRGRIVSRGTPVRK